MKYAEEIANLIPNAHFTPFVDSKHFPFTKEEAKFDEFVYRTMKVTGAV